MRTKIYNLIVLDESGSMRGYRQATITGCNETLNSIRSTQRQFEDTQEHFVSIFVFQENPAVPSRYIVKNKPVAEVADINTELYRPWGCTPLYDAIGSTLTDMRTRTDSDPDALGNVTIITDGYENASKRYTISQIASMIDALKEIGWSFNFIGANIDVKAVASNLNIDSTLEFEQTEEGTREMFDRQCRSREAWAMRANAIMCEEACEDPDADPQTITERRTRRFSRLKEAARKYFDTDL